MPKVRTHYDNLKVARNAPPEVIRAAYKSLSQKYHPDRNPGDKNCARIMAIINTSYDVLSNPAKRRKHDLWIEQREGEETLGSGGQESPRSTANFKVPEAGSLALDDLPERTQAVLIEWIRNKENRQKVIGIRSIWNTYFWALISAAWFFFLFYDSSQYRWSHEKHTWMVGISAFTGVLLCSSVGKIVEWHSSVLKYKLLITPLYVIRTEVDRVWYWPLWAIRDIKTTHSYRNGFYQGTWLEMDLGESNESFFVTSKSAYEGFIQNLQRFDSALRKSLADHDENYLVEHDFFDSCSGDSPSIRRKTLTERVLKAYLATIVVVVAVYGVSEITNLSARERKYAAIPRKAPQQASTSQQLRRQSYVRPSTTPYGTPWPTIASYVRGAEINNATGLSQVTVDNSRNNADFLVKLYYLGVAQPLLARVFFIPAYRDFTALSLSPGSYEVRYRNLSTGAMARSESFVLQEIRTGSVTNFSAPSITLYQVTDGNMRTYQITESEF